MDSALTPREMQSRIRAGATVDEVAQAAGVPAERVEAFAGPVLAEREFVAGLARKQHVRRGTQTVPHRTLEDVVVDRLSARGVDRDSLVWDSWRQEGRKWIVRVGFTLGTTRRDAHFLYDQDGRFSVPENDDARWLLGLHGPQPERRREESEPTVDLNGDIALVRVVQPPADPDLNEDTQPQPYGLTDDDSDAEDAYIGTDLEEVDGVLDFVPHSQMDVLYDMLSTFDEDSVQIYSGLVTPVVDDSVIENDEETRDLRSSRRVVPLRPDKKAATPAQPTPDEPGDTNDTSGANDTGEASQPDDPSGQPSLIEEEAPPAPKRARKSRKRASVPSWDEIVFGSPKNKE